VRLASKPSLLDLIHHHHHLLVVRLIREVTLLVGKMTMLITTLHTKWISNKNVCIRLTPIGYEKQELPEKWKKKRSVIRHLSVWAQNPLVLVQILLL